MLTQLLPARNTNSISYNYYHVTFYMAGICKLHPSGNELKISSVEFKAVNGYKDFAAIVF